MAVDKAALLAAIAQGGTAGKAAYEQAQAALAQQQQEAVRMALSSGVAQDSNSGAQAEIQRIIGQPYQNRTAQLTSNQAAMTDWFNRTGVNAGMWGDVMNGLQEAVAARAAAEAAGGGGGGSGGGGSGGGGGGEDPFDWYKNLQDTFGTQKLGFDAIEAEAKGLGMNSQSNPEGKPRYLQTRDYAQYAYGVPEAVAANEFQPSEYAYTGDADKPGAMEYAQTITRRSQLKPFKKALRQSGRATPGNQSYWNRQAIKAAKARVAPKKKKGKG